MTTNPATYPAANCHRPAGRRRTVQFAVLAVLLAAGLVAVSWYVGEQRNAPRVASKSRAQECVERDYKMRCTRERTAYYLSIRAGNKYRSRKVSAWTWNSYKIGDKYTQRAGDTTVRAPG